MGSSNKELYNDSLFLIVSFVVFAVFGLLLHADLTTITEKNDGVRLGTVVFKKRVAQRKYDDRVIWETIPNHSALYVNDSIRTADGSEAMLLLDDGTSIELGEETLIMLVRTGRKLGVNFHHGSLSALANEQSHTGFEITSGDAKLDLMRAGAVFRKDTGSEDVLVDITSGQAVLEKGGERFEVQENDRITFREGVVPEVKKASLIPMGGMGLAFIDAKKAAHTFSWSMIGADEVTFDIARNASFSRDVQSRTTREESIALDLEEGSWYWRLRAPDGSSSRIERTTLVAISDPQPLVPSDGAKITYFKETPLISLQWNGDEAASSYTVEIARDANFRDPVHELRSRSGSIAVSDLPGGQYWWRVTSQYASHSSAPRVFRSSPALSFTIEKNESPPVVEIIPVAAVSTLQLEAEQVVVSWKGNPEYAKYRLELSQRAGNFANPIYSEDTSANFSRFRNNIPEGKYYWRVSAMDAKNTILALSAVSEIEIRSPAPAILMSPGAGAALMGEDGEARVDFAWKDPNKTGRARFELAKTSDFSNPLRDLVMNGTSQSMQLPPGEYFWRVTVLHEQGKAAADAVTQRFTVSSRLSSPVLRHPAAGSVVDIGRTHSIAFAWHPAVGAEAYLFSLYHGNGRQPVFETRLTGTEYHFPHLHLLRRGGFSWEMRALQPGSGDIRTESKPTRSEFTIRLPELRHIEVETPEVIYAD